MKRYAILAGAVLGLLLCGGQAELQAELVGYWSFDDSGNPGYDDTGHGLNGTLYGDTAWTSGGLSGGALSFDGSGDYVEILDNGLLQITPDMTVAVWAKSPGMPGQEITTMIDKSHSNNSWTIHSGGWVSKYNLVAYGNSGYYWTDSDFNLTDDQWHHLVFTVDDSNGLKAYVDGVNTGTASYNGFQTNTDPLYFGSWGGTKGRYYKGLLDEIRIYNQELSAAEVQQLYSSTVPEASTLALLSLGLAVLSVFQWRRRKGGG